MAPFVLVGQVLVTRRIGRGEEKTRWRLAGVRRTVARDRGESGWAARQLGFIIRPPSFSLYGNASTMPTSSHVVMRAHALERPSPATVAIFVSFVFL